jgi:hypothetical protein
MCCACPAAETARAPEGLESYKLAEKPHQHPSEEDEEKLKVMQLHTWPHMQMHIWHLEMLYTGWASAALHVATLVTTRLCSRRMSLHRCKADSSSQCSLR